MTIVDFHNHFYPPQYLEEIKSGSSNIKITFDSHNNPLLHYPGDYNILVPEHRDIEFREELIKSAGITKQVLSFTTPGTHIESPDTAARLARLVNESFAEIVTEKADRFAALATLPQNNIKASIDELNHAVKNLGFKGVMLFSNVNGISLSHPNFWPIYQKAEELGAIIYIHPITPVGVEAMEEYWLMPLLGFTFDTTLAAAKIVFSGLKEKYEGIKWILGHLGGTVPYLAERLDRGYEAFKECRKNISKPPSEYLKDFYFDAVNFDPKAVQLAIDFAGVDHILAGSDHPHQIGSLQKMVTTIQTLNLTKDEKEAILGKNAINLLNMGH